MNVVTIRYMNGDEPKIWEDGSYNNYKMIGSLFIVSSKDQRTAGIYNLNNISSIEIKSESEVQILFED